MSCETLKLYRGSHGNGLATDGESCVWEAVSAHKGIENKTDHPPGACPALNSFGIGLNDLLNDDRPEWVELRTQRLGGAMIRRLAADKPTPEITKARREMAWLWAINVCVPDALESAAKALESAKIEKHPAILREHAAKCRNVTAAAAARYAAAAAARYAAAAARYAAAAARYAAAAARYAANAAAARYAAAAARYAANAADADAKRVELFNSGCDVFEKMVALGEIGDPTESPKEAGA